MKITFISLALASALLSGTPVAAKEVVVSFADLDLGTAQGLKVLQQRIDVAARKICEFDVPDTGTRLKSEAALQCVAEAKQRVQRQIAFAVEQQRRGG